MNDDDDSSMSRSFCPGGDKPSCDDSVAHPAATYNRHWQWTHTTPNCLRPWSLTFDLFYPRLQPHITVLDGHQDSSFYYPPIRVTCEKNLYEQRVFWILQLFIFGLFKERKKSASILGYKNHKNLLKLYRQSQNTLEHTYYCSHEWHILTLCSLCGRHAMSRPGSLSLLVPRKT